MYALEIGDVYIDFPFERTKIRYNKATHKVYRRFYGDVEIELQWSDELLNEAIRGGKQITHEDYLRD